MKRNFETGDEEGIKMKEQAILSLGKMLSKHGKAEGIIMTRNNYVAYFIYFKDHCDIIFKVPILQSLTVE